MYKIPRFVEPSSSASEFQANNLLFNDSGLASSPNQYSETSRIVHFSPPPLQAQPTVNPHPLREPPAVDRSVVDRMIKSPY